MFLKKLKKTFILCLLLTIIIPQNVFAYSDYIIASGENIGIKLKSDGIIVVGLYEVNDTYPAMDAGIKIGDILTSVDDNNVSNIEELVDALNKSNGNIKIGYIRNDIVNYTNLKLYKEDDVYKTGLYVKDNIIGTGTLTFIDPNTKIFGALGHEITEKNTGKILKISDGNIFESKVISIQPSINGIPGSKNAKFNFNNKKGIINENTNKGVFGTYIGEFNQDNLYKVANISDIKKGKAQILTVIKDNKVEKFDINIIKVQNKETKNILFEVTDERLLELSNGIVQGMSGSPIIQGEYIIGAVTHVVVENPNKGYGILITNMLKEAEN